MSNQYFDNMGFFDNDSNDNGGFFGGKPKKKKGLFDGFFGEGYKPDAWRKDIPYNDTHDSHIWDWDANDKDGDGYRDGSVGDSDLWDD